MSKKTELFGSLVRYGDKSTQVFFRNGSFKRHVIFLGGLSDGLLATRYIEPLAQALTGLGWSVIQPVLSSSWSGYGMATLDQPKSAEKLLGMGGLGLKYKGV
ncbi:hypothetical protein CBR_g23273 [Chara braunii]|uniref:Uncharacterized protein n=1 Tax=Chara braunii TaxID=69332 RepID=A0A388JVA9_CHABU|nr:hypothetical protein CBR_g23273 [Chara braunii]|eukprot:GBG61759.1 hypothetical protein CBR_g23273 [Chara braunii]